MRNILSCSMLLFLLASGSASAFCFSNAGARYQIDPLLLKAIAMQESSLNPQAINVNRSKSQHRQIISTDYGLMQINSRHLSALFSLKIIASGDELLSNPCLNVQVGAWILARHLNICGISWSCLGSYNAGFSRHYEQRRIEYARRISITYSKLILEDIKR
jgi:soluble lytic murein transglycosylase-like protein